MSLFNLSWRKYNLNDNPYFQQPLIISDGKIPMSAFIGRKKEIGEITKMIELGEGRFFIIGDSGVGKTTLLNYVRNLARKGEFFSPENEIEINQPMSAQEFVLTTLNRLYYEVKNRKMTLSPELKEILERLCDVSCYENNEDFSYKLNYEKLKEIYFRTIKEISYPRFKGIILHYDNLDNIKEPELIEKMFGEIRDLLMKSSNVIFFFVGNKFLPEDIGYNPRIRQIFYFPPTEISRLKFNDVKRILEERIKYLKKNNELPAICPHTEGTLKTLFELHNGNLRDTLKSLSACIMELSKNNNPIIIDEILMQKLLVEKVEKDYLNGLTDTEREILKKILDFGNSITPSKVSEITGKNVQNIASKYIPKLMRKSALEFEGKEGRNTYYKVAPEIVWWKLSKEEIKNDMKEKKVKKEEEINRKLSDFM
jgi:GTPase SAR1 family protein